MDTTDFLKGFLKTVKLSPVQLSILAEAMKKPGASVPLLASALSMTTSAAGKVVDALVKRGFLQKDQAAVQPTAKGAEVWSAVAQAIGGAASIATAVSGFIHTMGGVVKKWSDRAMPPKPKRKK